jgi:uncharacterized membrane protein YbhN (UPF0104 family)
VKRWVPWLGAAASVVCAGFFLRAIARNWHALSRLDWGVATIAAVLGALACYLFTYALASRSWQLELRLVGIASSYVELARIVLRSQFAKYLPGNVGHHVGRVLLAGRAGLDIRRVIPSMILDTTIVLLAGAFAALPAMALVLRVLEQRQMHIPNPTALAAVGALGLSLALLMLSLPLVRRKLGALVPKDLLRWNAATAAQALLCQIASFALGATALYLLLIVMGVPSSGSQHLWIQVAGIYSAAWLMGFLMPGAPAGLGVREFVLLLGLSPLFGEAQATAASLMLRLITTLGDGIAFMATFAGSPAESRNTGHD